ncbi:MAG TPA: hypothetical protein VMS78_03425 [Rhizomicrobium sp.]|nr:hypothetical protein [Rhizomicrobium sp.]
MARKSKSVAEFGDFQTPPDLALGATRLLKASGIKPGAIVEPTCGRGSFLSAAMQVFPKVRRFVGVEINRQYLKAAEECVSGLANRQCAELHHEDFFDADWDSILQNLPEPIVILGNPPWVTSSELGSLASDNLPEKSNFKGHKGLDAVTGKSNFDISEWMILRYLDWLGNRSGTIAVLCKSAVARKILAYAWKQNRPVAGASVYQIDAGKHFGAAVDACLFVLRVGRDGGEKECRVFASLNASEPEYIIGFRNGILVTNVEAYERRARLLAKGPDTYVWRSGIKHDCSKVMEFAFYGDQLKNGFNELVALEDDLLFPLLKSSDVGNGRTTPRRAMLVTQRRIGEATNSLSARAPRCWEYLMRHADALNARTSVIYRGKPPFSIFGVGDYSFSPWKIAISGFYKKLEFSRIGPVGGRPVVFDDTIYFLPCWSEQEATFLWRLLNSHAAREFLESMISWSEKRPITTELLKRLSIRQLAEDAGASHEYEQFAQPAGTLFSHSVRAA